MVLISTRTTGPLTTRLAVREKARGWHITGPEEDDPDVVARYACDCNGITLAQIIKPDDITGHFAISVTCPRDGARSERPYRLPPWAVADFMARQVDWICSKGDEPVATITLFDGVVVGMRVDCPICRAPHDIDLSLGAIPAELRRTVFGITQPQPILSPPVMDLLHGMWSCLREAPDTNSFTYIANTMRYDSGRVIHSSSQCALNTEADYLEQLAAAGLIEDGEHISISALGIDHCQHEFGEGVS